MSFYFKDVNSTFLFGAGATAEGHQRSILRYFKYQRRKWLKEPESKIVWDKIKQKHEAGNYQTPNKKREYSK